MHMGVAVPLFVTIWPPKTTSDQSWSAPNNKNNDNYKMQNMKNHNMALCQIDLAPSVAPAQGRPSKTHKRINKIDKNKKVLAVFDLKTSFFCRFFQVFRYSHITENTISTKIAVFGLFWDPPNQVLRKFFFKKIYRPATETFKISFLRDGTALALERTHSDASANHSPQQPSRRAAVTGGP